MGVFEKIFKRPRLQRQVDGYFQMLDGYTPIFTDYDGGIYEMELTRACIHAFANHCSKLLPVITGPDSKGVQAILDGKPNPFMTTPQFLYKVATLYDAKNTCFIVPILDEFDRLIGYYPVNPAQVEILDVGGEPWLRYTFKNGKKAAIEFARCGVVSKYLYNSDIKGETNQALNPTLQLLNIQNQGIAEGIKNSASFRFMASVSNFSKNSDLVKERKNWVKENLSADAGGLALFPNTYSNVQQVQSTPKIVDPEQMKITETRVLNYFGSNEKILQNRATGDDWSAYYEGKIEPFAVQLSLAMTCMSYSQNERTRGNEVVWSANRLQYMSNSEKLQTSSQLFDRGILSLNMVMDIWNLPHVEDGDKRYIRKEYTEISQLDQVAALQEQLTAAQNQLNATKNPPEDPEEEPEKEVENDTDRQNQIEE
jgi:hypothetical protein